MTDREPPHTFGSPANIAASFLDNKIPQEQAEAQLSDLGLSDEAVRNIVEMTLSTRVIIDDLYKR